MDYGTYLRQKREARTQWLSTRQTKDASETIKEHRFTASKTVAKYNESQSALIAAAGNKPTCCETPTSDKLQLITPCNCTQ